MKPRLFTIAALFGLMLAGWGCRLGGTQEIHDLIQPLSLVAGRSDTVLISDMFYADDYDLRFSDHPRIDIHYDPEDRRLVVRPDRDFEGHTLLEFTLDREVYQIPVTSRIQQKERFTYRPRRKPKRMNIMGTFNDWNRGSLPMQDDDGDGAYEITLALDPGVYLYQFVVDSNEIYDPENPERIDNGFGGFNSVVTIPPRYKHTARLNLLDAVAEKRKTVLSFSYDRKDQPAPLRRDNVIGLVNNRRVADQQLRLQGERLSLLLNNDEMGGETVVRVAVTQAGQTTNTQTVRFNDGRLMGSDGVPFSWHDAIIYSIMIDRFFDGDKKNSVPVVQEGLSQKTNYLGGDLQGIVQKIDEGYFDSLGVNVLWLSPTNDNTDKAYREWPAPHRYSSAYHGYWPIDARRVEERFGDIALLKSLVAKAHEHNIRVLLDFIANHVHIDHPFYKQHRDWFGQLELPDGRKNIRFWDEYRLTTWFEPFLPSFDYVGSHEALQAMTDNAVWWLKETGIDGFRLDAVKHVPNRFWRLLTKKIKSRIAIPEKREIFQIGETFGSYDLIKSYVNNGQLNSQFNFNLYDVAMAVFLQPDGDFSMLANELQKSLAVYGIANLMGNLMDSHDKIRYMAYADGDLRLNSSEAAEIGWTDPPHVDHASSYAKARLYLTYLMTIPGIPSLYYGDEIGMTGAADPDNRRMMRFGDAVSELERQMLHEVRQIVRLRRQHSALRYGDFQALVANTNCFVYLRSDMRERILVGLNKSEISQTIDIELPTDYACTAATNLLDGRISRIDDNKLTVAVPAIGSSVLKLETEQNDDAESRLVDD